MSTPSAQPQANEWARSYIAHLKQHNADLRRLVESMRARLKGQAQALRLAREALAALLDRDQSNTCQHDITHRGGALWTICDACGAKWADDQGGMPRWKDPARKRGREALAAIDAIPQQDAQPSAPSGERLRVVAEQVLRDMRAQGLLIEWQTVLADALSAPSGEAVAWMRRGTKPEHGSLHNITLTEPDSDAAHNWTPLYAGTAPAAQAQQPHTMTEEQIERHGMPASECPPNSQVILVSSIRRLLGLTLAETAATASVAIIDSPETGYPSRIIDGQHVPCAHDGRVHTDVLPATASVAGLASPRDDYDDGDSFAGMCTAPQALPAQEAPSYVQRGWLIEWPGLGGKRRTIWSDSDAAAKAIRCPHEPVFAARAASPAPAAPANALLGEAREAITALLKLIRLYAPQLSGKTMGFAESVAQRIGADQAATPQEAPARQGLTQAAQDVLAERRRQIEVEGWTPEHDDEHSAFELSDAAACYALGSEAADVGDVPDCWPQSWDESWWRPSKDRRRNLVKATALLLAEIERLDRAHGIPAPAAREGER